MNENDNLKQNNLNEESINETTNTQESQTTDTNTASNEPPKHSKFIETLINASDNPEESRKEWDEITKEYQDAKNEVLADITKKKTLKERITDIAAILLLIAVVALIVRGCSANSPKNRAIKNVQNLVFEDYGGTNFDIYVNETLTDVIWESEKLGNDRWAVYMSGYSSEYDLQLMVQIVLTYGDDDTYTGEVVYVEYNGVGYSDYDSIRYALAIIYDTVNQEFVSDYMGYLLGF